MLLAGCSPAGEATEAAGTEHTHSSASADASTSPPPAPPTPTPAIDGLPGMPPVVDASNV